MSSSDGVRSTVSAHSAPLMSPAQAAQAAGVSRWSITRAIKAMKLPAIRDNRGNWRIAPDDVAAWSAAQAAQCAHSVQDGPETGQSAQAAPPAAQAEILAELRESLAAAKGQVETERARADAAERARDQAESQRDEWQSIAQKLADRPRRWWQFK